MSIEDGGPTFPTIKWERDEDGNFYPNESEGMTLRDHFAGLVMQGMLSGKPIKYVGDIEKYATQAYEIADAMLRAREEV